MKIKIEYDYFGYDYRAFVIIGGRPEVALSEVSFEDAKKQLIEKIQKPQRENPPEPEEVEIWKHTQVLKSLETW